MLNSRYRRVWTGKFPSFGMQVWLVGLTLLLLLLPATGLAQVQSPSASPANSTQVNPIQSGPTRPTGSLDELQQQQRKIETERSNIDQQRQQLRRQETSAQKTLRSAQGDVKATAAEIAQNEKRLQQQSQRLKQLERALSQAEQVYSVQQTATVARLKFLQRQRNSYGWALLLQSKNLNDFLDRRYQLSRIYQNDRQILAQLKTDADALLKQRRQVEGKKNEIALLTQQLYAQKLESQKEAQQQQALINRLRLDHGALEAAEEQLAKDSDNIVLLIQKRLGVRNPGVGVQKGKGLLSYPCDGEMTSGFGYRMHPILGYSRFHSGLDFGADYGTPIRAAAPGKVLFAGWYGGYGQTVILDHGNNVTTLYGHTSEIYISEGQTVPRGTPIAAVGSTGLSTGPHLHFEVRIGGNPVDPQDYL